VAASGASVAYHPRRWEGRPGNDVNGVGELRVTVLVLVDGSARRRQAHQQQAPHFLPVCLVVEPQERSGADPLPRVLGWGATPSGIFP
jgi:hypothetical protein